MLRKHQSKTSVRMCKIIACTRYITAIITLDKY